MPHHPVVFRFALSLCRHHCAALRSALSFCSVTAHAHAPIRKVYVPLVYLLLFAVSLLCCDMLWYSCKISFTGLFPAMLCSHSMIIQWGKKVFSQPQIVQVLPLKKMREACNFHHRYTSTMRDKIRKKIQKITL